MKRWALRIVLICSLTGIAACSHLESYLEIGRAQGMSQEYLAVLKQWTQHQVIYSEFETQAHIGATYQGPGFNRAYLAEFARIYHLTGEDQMKRDDILKRTSADVTEFIFYAAIPEKTSNDFDKRGSIWTVFLVNGKGERVDPQEVRRITPITPVTTTFFPYINPYYGMAYRIRFPLVKQAESTPLTLVVTSVLGKAELTFAYR